MLIAAVLGASVLATSGGAVTAWMLMGANTPVSSLTEADTVERVGRDGHLGAPGTAGFNGASGEPGISGPAGRDGAAGRNGTDGLDGATGRDGANGFVGSNGASGRDGSNGRDGANGAAGVTGPRGVDGLAGAPGAQGATGAAGANGLAGAAGSQGPKGDDGEKGEKGVQGEPANRNVALAQLADVTSKDGVRTPLLFGSGVLKPEGLLGQLPIGVSDTGVVTVPDSGVYRVTLSVRNTTKNGYSDAALQIGTPVPEKGNVSFFASERSGSQASGSYWMHTTIVLFLTKNEQLVGYLTVIGSNEVLTDHGWLILEKLTP
jgi:hypothetical protein